MLRLGPIHNYPPRDNSFRKLLIGFAPSPSPSPPTVFKTGAFNRSATTPRFLNNRLADSNSAGSGHCFQVEFTRQLLPTEEGCSFEKIVRYESELYPQHRYSLTIFISHVALVVCRSCVPDDIVLIDCGLAIYVGRQVVRKELCVCTCESRNPEIASGESLAKPSGTAAHRGQLIGSRTPVVVHECAVADLDGTESGCAPRPPSLAIDDLRAVRTCRGHYAKILVMPGDVGRIAAGTIEVDVQPPGKTVKVTGGVVGSPQLRPGRACPSHDRPIVPECPLHDVVVVGCVEDGPVENLPATAHQGIVFPCHTVIDSLSANSPAAQDHMR